MVETLPIACLEKSKTVWWSYFLNASENVHLALTKLGIEDKASDQVLMGCEELICLLFSKQSEQFQTAENLMWYHFCRQNQNLGMTNFHPHKVPCTSTSAHLQGHIWHQTLTPLQRCLEPTDIGWSRGSNGELKPIRMPIVPRCVLQFVKRGCRKSMCKGNRSCRINNLQCTELCACVADAQKCKK